jgi:hypothetical protein
MIEHTTPFRYGCRHAPGRTVAALVSQVSTSEVFPGNTS